MNIKKRQKRAYVIWVIVSVLMIISMIGFLLAPIITGF